MEAFLGGHIVRRIDNYKYKLKIKNITQVYFSKILGMAVLSRIKPTTGSGADTRKLCIVSTPTLHSGWRNNGMITATDTWGLWDPSFMLRSVIPLRWCLRTMQRATIPFTPTVFCTGKLNFVVSIQASTCAYCICYHYDFWKDVPSTITEKFKIRCERARATA